MREAKALILRLEQEKKVALQDMMDNLQLALREKDEAVKNMSDSRQVLEERSVQLQEMKKEKDEFFHKMEKQLEESEKRLEIAELKKEREVSIFPLNNIHEKISPFWLVKSSAVFFENSAEKS